MNLRERLRTLSTSHGGRRLRLPAVIAVIGAVGAVGAGVAFGAKPSMVDLVTGPITVNAKKRGSEEE